MNMEVNEMDNKMFCYQCQETAGCKGCTVSGVCGKKPEVAAMQDLLVYVTKGLSAVTTRLREEGQPISAGVDQLISVNMFETITNANFDQKAIEDRITETLRMKRFLLNQTAKKSDLPAAALWDGGRQV